MRVLCGASGAVLYTVSLDEPISACSTEVLAAIGRLHARGQGWVLAPDIAHEARVSAHTARKELRSLAASERVEAAKANEVFTAPRRPEGLKAWRLTLKGDRERGALLAEGCS